MTNPEGINPVSAAGSTISTLYGERKVRVYPVLDTELSTISYMNALSTLCFSAGGYFFDKVLNLETQSISYTNPFFTISIFSFLVGILSIGIRWHAIHTIKKQTAKNVKL